MTSQRRIHPPTIMKTRCHQQNNPRRQLSISRRSSIKDTRPSDAPSFAPIAGGDVGRSTNRLPRTPPVTTARKHIRCAAPKIDTVCFARWRGGRRAAGRGRQVRAEEEYAHRLCSGGECVHDGGTPCYGFGGKKRAHERRRSECAGGGDAVRQHDTSEGVM